MPGLVPGIHVFLWWGDKDVDGRDKPTSVRHGLCLKRCTALILLVSSSLRINWTRKGINAVQHQNIVFHGLLKNIPWATVDRLVDPHGANWDPPSLKTKVLLIAILYAQFYRAPSPTERAPDTL